MNGRPAIASTNRYVTSMNASVPARLLRRSTSEARADLPRLHGPRGGDDGIVSQMRPTIVNLRADSSVEDVYLSKNMGLKSLNEGLSYRAPKNTDPFPRPRSIWALQEWRLRRVVEHVDARLTSRLTLQKLANVAGLSRMHFAAQFKLATGMSPHQFVLNRRIERAKTMLIGTAEELVGVALGVGFQSQAHFTTVFKRFVGETPHRWRCENRRMI